MPMTTHSCGQTRPREKSVRVLALWILGLALAACSVPDYANPGNWFDSKEKKQEIAAAKPAPDKNQPYPKLSSVPDRPDPITIARIRKELTEGLIGDTENARYTDEIIRRESPVPAPRPVQATKASPTTQKPVTAKLSTVKPTQPPKLAIAPAASGTTNATQSETAESGEATTASEAAAGTAMAKLKIAVAPTGSAEVQQVQPQKLVPPPKLVTSVPGIPKPATGTVALARPAPPPPPPTLPQVSAPVVSLSGVRPAQSAQIATIFFGIATAALTKDDVSVLREVSELQREIGGTIRVVGHSSRGAPTVDRVKRGLLNFKLSLNRANAVAAALTRFGVPKDHLEVIARGDGELLYAESSAAGAAGNRRAEIFLDFF